MALIFEQPPDRFATVFGSLVRGRGLIDADFADGTLSRDAQEALASLISEIAGGQLETALVLLESHASRALAADISSEHPALSAIRRALSERVAADILVAWREPTRDFLHLAGVRSRNASCLLTDQGVVHVWPAGTGYASPGDARALELACGDLAGRLQAAPRGAWAEPGPLRRCLVCEHALKARPLSAAPKRERALLKAELQERRDYEPLPKDWERLCYSNVKWAFAGRVEDRLRLLLGDIVRGKERRLPWNEATLRHHANGIYSEILRALVRALVAADLELAVLRALNHPRRLYCDTLQARKVRCALAGNTLKIKDAVAAGLFDRWAPHEPILWTERQRLSRGADAADHVEEQLRYYSGTADCKYPRRQADPDMAAPAPTPPWVRQPRRRTIRP